MNHRWRSGRIKALEKPTRSGGNNHIFADLEIGAEHIHERSFHLKIFAQGVGDHIVAASHGKPIAALNLNSRFFQQRFIGCFKLDAVRERFG